MQDRNDGPFTAYYNDGLGGYELYVLDGREKIVWRYVPPGCGPGKPHRCGIKHTAKGRPYFMARGRRIHLDQCLRKHAGP